MFDWLFEKKVHGTLYFETGWEDKYVTSWEIFMNVFEVISKHESIKERIEFKLWKHISKDMWENVTMRQETSIFGDETKPFYWRIEVDCWESAWKELEQLPWVTGTAKAL